MVQIIEFLPAGKRKAHFVELISYQQKPAAHYLCKTAGGEMICVLPLQVLGKHSIKDTLWEGMVKAFAMAVKATVERNSMERELNELRKQLAQGA